MIISSLASFERLSGKNHRSGNVKSKMSTAPSTPTGNVFQYQHINHSYLNGKKLSKSSKHYRSVPKKANNIGNLKSSSSSNLTSGFGSSNFTESSGINNRRAKMHIRLNNNIINNIIMKNMSSSNGSFNSNDMMSDFYSNPMSYESKASFAEPMYTEEDPEDDGSLINERAIMMD